MKIFIKTLVLLLISSGLFAQVGLKKLAQNTMTFLQVSQSPKASAMGDAYFAVGTGSDAIYYNPAMMGNSVRDFDLTINYTQWIADINYFGGAVSYRYGNYGTFGLHLMTVDYGDIIGTKLVPPSMAAAYPEGYIETGMVGNVGAYSIGFSYAKNITEMFSIGGTIKYVGQNLGNNTFYTGETKDNKAAIFVFDAGVFYQTAFKDFRFGMAIRNFSSDLKREEFSDQLPLNFVLAGAMNVLKFFKPESDNKIESFTIAADFVHPNDFTERLNVGAEYKFMGQIFVRAGYQTNRDLASWSAGAGLLYTVAEKDIQVNYSFSKFDVFKDVSRLSLNFGF